ncbi:MAG: Kazal-type serine protease inhibitor, partial [Candidatus Paceibacterota bacterium]
MNYEPVCGSNGRTFSNACMAAASGVPVQNTGACSSPSGTQGTLGTQGTQGTLGTLGTKAVSVPTTDEILEAMSLIAKEEHMLRENAWNESGHLRMGSTDFALNNSLDFPVFVDRHYHKYRLTKGLSLDCYSQEKEELFEYQKFVKNYINTVSPYRGILLYYGLGAGKTRSSIEIAQQFANTGHMCLFISKAKLIDNFAKELAKWRWTWGKTVFKKDNYEIFINENNKSGNKGREYLKLFGVGYAAYDSSQYKLCQLQGYVNQTTKRLTNLVIVIDEVHNLSQMLSNGLNAG